VPTLIGLPAPEYCWLVAELRACGEELRLVYHHEEVHRAVNNDGLLTILRQRGQCAEEHGCSHKRDEYAAHYLPCA
jgi:hypothetical protein